jgi:hypothetical protein
MKTRDSPATAIIFLPTPLPYSCKSSKVKKVVEILQTAVSVGTIDMKPNVWVENEIVSLVGYRAGLFNVSLEPALN